MNQYAHLIGRILIAIIFIVAGAGKISDPAGTMGYMESVGVPGILLWPTIALELLGGIAIIIGFQTRLIAALLAIFCIAAALLFHFDFNDSMQSILFLKDIAIAGGLLMLASTGPQGLSLDK
ncbi:putative oxidoreductase [Methylobacillus rhizosphaerae]|uniref:Putative oxidoreductase n=1 Tax=Methylobacillus rhizosphaerae TaxID=551994 RepID=A0A238Y1P9_9PROT|nr:DoxX family protein [Methylobacillus rhizosphaerae]SNR64910.1 putative oxidoreductase [Methylobacillus rhizosphaerae]